MAVQFSNRAFSELDAIFKRILEYSRDDREYSKQVTNLANELLDLAANPLLGTSLKGRTWRVSTDGLSETITSG